METQRLVPPVFGVVGLVLVISARAIQRVAIRLYKDDPFQFEWVRRWIISEWYVWSLRGFGVLLILAVAWMYSGPPLTW